jgi:type II secretory pathway pseudopilin PulG
LERVGIRIAAALIIVIALLAIYFAWRAEIRSRAELAAEVNAAKQAMTAVEERQQARDAKLADTLAAIAAEKRTVQSPAQIVKDLPNQIPLPVPIVIQNIPSSQPTGSKTQGMAPGTNQPSGVTSDKPSPVSNDSTKVQGVIAGPDLKPLYDFALDCKTCQAKLSAAQSDLTDEKGKSTILIKERDHALRLARGGSIWQRVGHATKWILIGALPALWPRARRTKILFKLSGFDNVEGADSFFGAGAPSTPAPKRSTEDLNTHHAYNTYR